MGKRQEKFNGISTNLSCQRQAGEQGILSGLPEHSSTQKSRISVRDIRSLESSGRKKEGKPSLFCLY